MVTIRTGILGSAFDPPHYAHAAMAILALDSGEIDELWLCPSPARWDKTPLAPLEMRLRWSQLFAETLQSLGYPVTVNTEELKQGIFRGSYVFFSHLKESFPEREFFPIVGRDSWDSIPLWRDPVTATFNGHEMLRDFSFLIAPRIDGTDRSSDGIPFPHKELPSLLSMEQRFQALFKAPQVAALSSSSIRESLHNGVKIHFCFANVENDILENNPYR
jgi:nicotinate-nucleotide adenylyltransferase